MPWNVEMPLIFRSLIDDFGDPPKYADSRVLQLLLVSAQMIQNEIPFDVSYVANFTTLTLVPDPTDRVAATRDDAFINLTILKAACMLSHSEIRNAANRSITIKDGSSMIDLKRDLGGTQLVVKNFCDAYNDAKFAYGAGGIGGRSIPGEAIVGPFKVFPNHGGLYNDGRYCRGYY